MDSPKVLKDNKRKIKVDFERTSLKESLEGHQTFTSYRYFVHYYFPLHL